MPTTAAIPEVSAPALDREVAGGCPACPHPSAGHDLIATRFCAATVVGKFSRGCVCPPASTT
jgi:hypothetical protein